jgi:hypothetical protein
MEASPLAAISTQQSATPNLFSRDLTYCVVFSWTETIHGLTGVIRRGSKYAALPFFGPIHSRMQKTINP